MVTRKKTKPMNKTEEAFLTELRKRKLNPREVSGLITKLQKVKAHKYSPVQIDFPDSRVKFGVFADAHMGHSCYRADILDKMIKDEEPIIFGDGKQTRDFIYVIDLAEFIVESIDKNPEHKLFHLADGKQISVNKITDILKKELKFKKEIKHTKAIKGEVRDIVLDISLAKKELGWKPKHTIEQGLIETIKCFQNGKI